mmetsp:Transcript_42168/g.82715  ORF Transcript_42168/g.82715 Transcript_42168/m.82715 type:complete len:230 (+) Transcript_42168:94-783(+)|eukprot:CAMPEP_0194336256 /NCGR_PEP_ID=MMETSP0171-20130528/72331_1 /TAXON_ID=218684 /ORGANISM="Corethron pennatum, Strain L29A3" /LENGTH=229 /DNA_ID=CAMNT_0039099635 /DNA_START=62 /DNA_END=751 /DNA_ORIENTATION=+
MIRNYRLFPSTARAIQQAFHPSAPARASQAAPIVLIRQTVIQTPRRLLSARPSPSSSKTHVFRRGGAGTMSAYRRQLLVVLTSFFAFLMSNRLYGCKMRADALAAELEALKGENEEREGGAGRAAAQRLARDGEWIERIVAKIAAAKIEGRAERGRGWFGRRGGDGEDKDEDMGNLIRSILLEELTGKSEAELKKVAGESDEKDDLSIVEDILASLEEEEKIDNERKFI